MMTRCPCCNARLQQTSICPRCRADLINLISVEKSAEFWLATAIHLLLENKVEKSCIAIKKSLHLKTSETAIVFREFLIDQQSQLVLDLLLKAQVLSAKKILYQVRLLNPQSRRLQPLADFTDYLLLKESCSKSDIL